MTIPKELRGRYGIRAGEEVVFEEHADGLLVRRVVPEDPLRALLGCVTKDIDVDRYLEETRGAAWSRDMDG